jgi:hypothetical protein
MRRSLRVRGSAAAEHRGRLDRLAFAIETTPVRPAVATLMREHVMISRPRLCPPTAYH